MGDPAGLAPEFARALGLIAGALGPERFYLAGGTAIALHLGHRTSRDLDLMSFSAAEDLRAVEVALRAHIPGLRVRQETDVTMHAEVEGVPVDLVQYPFAPMDPPGDGPAGMRVAGLRDLAVMKLAAISGRGVRRDFWDLHEIVTRAIALDAALKAYHLRFGMAARDLYHVVRALTYFADAEKDPVWPEGLTPTHWAATKAWFAEHAPPLLVSLDL